MIDRALKNPSRAEIYQQMFMTQTQGRFELARSLAVPRYETEPQVDALVQQSAELASNADRALMYSAASVTGRSENFKAMLGNKDDAYEYLTNVDQLVF